MLSKRLILVLQINDKEFQKIMNEKPKNWHHYPTYKKYFEKLRLLFFIIAKSNYVSMSFYIKYCLPISK